MTEPDEPMAPKWVQSVTPMEIRRQRAEGWPDFHPEDFCHECGQRNPVWWADGSLWNLVAGVAEILCPSCVAARLEMRLGGPVVLELSVPVSSKNPTRDAP